MAKKSSLNFCALMLPALAIAGFVGVSIINNRAAEPQTKGYDLEQLKSISIDHVVKKMAQSKSIPYESIYGPSIQRDTLSGQAKVSSLPTKAPIDWQYMFGTNRSVNFNMHSWDMIHPLLYAYENNHRKEYLELALKIALDWISNNEVLSVNSEEKNFAWYDMAVGIRIYRAAYILENCIKNKVGGREEYKAVYLSLLDHFNYLKNKENIVLSNNHGIYQSAGQKAAARRLEPISDVFQAISRQATYRLRLMVGYQFTSEGVHKEHSPGYHYAVYSTLLRLKRDNLIQNKGDLDKLSLSGNALWWMLKPSGSLVEFGDTEWGTTVNDIAVSEDTQSPYMLHHLSKGQSGSIPKASIKTFPRSGLAVVKNGNSYLALQAAFHSQYHKHADNQSFVWYDKGRDILVDSGKYGYLGRTQVGTKEYDEGFWYSDPKRQYVEKTRAHNTVEVDGRDYLRKGAKPFGSAIKDSGFVDGTYFTLSATKEFDSINFDRLLIYRPEEWIIVVDDIKDTSGSNHNYKQWFHFDKSISIKKTGSKYVANLGDGTSLRVQNLEKSSSRMIGPFVGQTKPYYQGWYSPAPYVLEPNPALAFAANGSETHFATVFSFGDTDVAYSRNSNNSQSAKLLFTSKGETKKLYFKVSTDKKVTLSYE